MSKNNSDIYIVMPAYNESDQLRVGVEMVQKKGYQNIVVVNDGSKDNTYDVMMSIKGIHALSHKINRGQGAALQTGITYALQKGAQYIVLIDADGQHSVDEIQSMLHPVMANECDITIGTRFKGDVSRSNVPFMKKFMLKIGIWIIWFLFGSYITDSQNGFKAMNRKAAEAMKFSFNRYEYCTEIIDLIRTNHLRVQEVPVTVRYTEHSLADGQKMSNSIKIVWHMFWYKLNKIVFK